MASISGPIDGEFKILFCTGKTIRTPSQKGNYAKVKFDVPLKKIIEVMTEEGMGHHLVVGLGDLTEELKHITTLLGFRQVM